MSEVRLYYINNRTRQLEIVENQSVDVATETINADITHFSDCVAGITPQWTGDGLNMGLDYVHNGEEHASVAGRSLTILASMYNIKGRGMDINLVRAYSPTVDRWRVLGISESFLFPI